MSTLLWILTVIGSLIGGLVLLLGVMLSKGAPQEAAAASIAACLAVIAYCLAQAVSELKNK